jgi:hypothetical protein
LITGAKVVLEGFSRSSRAVLSKGIPGSLGRKELRLRGAEAGGLGAFLMGGDVDDDGGVFDGRRRR